ncbi:LOW QUALITY PROTEIN: WD repeat-containing protein 62-like, partial [Anopheles cruzii]|uniref:LOW QUALITY PROTEIN: WD repeat-containing protein 62-like n=1 Tax=Anopheles cruzii TaxID=68878 RepID=UPI0022EC5CF4
FDNASSTTSTSGEIECWLQNPDGTVGTPPQHTAPMEVERRANGMPWCERDDERLGDAAAQNASIASQPEMISDRCDRRMPTVGVSASQCTEQQRQAAKQQLLHSTHVPESCHHAARTAVDDDIRPDEIRRIEDRHPPETQQATVPEAILHRSACIRGVETVPFSYQYSSGKDAASVPSNYFMIHPSDDSNRVWDVDGRDIYSKELMEVPYIDDEMSFTRDTVNPVQGVKQNASYDGRNGVWCIKIAPHSRRLAMRDRSGDIRIYNISNPKLTTTIGAHELEVLRPEYENEKIIRGLLDSTSRDRLVHILDCDAKHRIPQTLDDHSSSIMPVQFLGVGKQFQMVSCGADKPIIFHHYQNDVFLRGNNGSGKDTLYHMEVDKHILTACQDWNICVYSTRNAKPTKAFKGSQSDEGGLIKVGLDLSGVYFATSCTDKTPSLYDYYANERMAQIYGRGEPVTRRNHTDNCKYLIAACGDGCVFIWREPHTMIITMAFRSGHRPIPCMLQLTNPVTSVIPNHPPNQGLPADAGNAPGEYGLPPNRSPFLLTDPASVVPGYRYADIGQLLQWAKRRRTEDQCKSPVLGSSPSQGGNNFGGIATKPRGRWSQRGRLEEPPDLRHIVDRPLNVTLLQNKLMVDAKALHTPNSDSSTVHDGDPEDISDNERTNSDHGMMYYPSSSPSTPTDFNINDADTNGFRKSIRRQKLEKQGPGTSAQLQSAVPDIGTSTRTITGTGTGAGNSDDEDKGSTPSGNNADRSLRSSTLGGSSRSSSQQTSSGFLQAVLIGSGHLSD